MYSLIQAKLKDIITFENSGTQISGMSGPRSDQRNVNSGDSLLENVRTKLIDAANEKVCMYHMYVLYIRMCVFICV